MKRFSNAQVGDKVYCRLNGCGVIDNVRAAGVFHLSAVFDDEMERYTIDYTMGGKHMLISVEAILFYRDETSNYLTERPAPKLDWSKVPVDTKITVNSSSAKLRRYFCKYEDGYFYFHDDGATSWSANRQHRWDTVALAEPVTIDGITYPIGTKGGVA